MSTFFTVSVYRKLQNQLLVKSIYKILKRIVASASGVALDCQVTLDKQ